MPGLAAIIAEPHRPDLSQGLDRMLGALTYPGYRTVRLSAPELGFALGHTGPTRGPEAGPGCWPADVATDTAQVVALVEGEPQGLADVARQLGLAPSASSNAVMAALYAHKGVAGLAQLRGHWALALIDRRAGTAVFANDHYGTRNLFRMQASDRAWLVASHPAALLAYPAAIREMHPAGIADYLAFSHALGRKTIFRGVESLPGASCLVFHGTEPREERYWRPLPPPIQPHDPTELAATLEAVRELFNRSVYRALALSEPYCLALTGGMDARAILSAMAAADIRPHTLTHCIPGSTDAVLSAALADRAGAPHHFYEVRGQMLPQHLPAGVKLLGGLVAGIDVHPLCFLDALTDFTHVVVTGLGADVMRLDHSGVNIVPGRDTAETLVEDIRSYHNSVFATQDALPALLNPDAAPDLAGQPVRSIREYVTAQQVDVPLDEIGSTFFLEERVPKIWVKGDLIVRRELETRHPFLDPDLLARAWALPRPVRLAALAHRYIITRNAPALADVPYERDGLPLRYPFTWAERGRAQLQRLRSLVATRLGRRWERRPNYRYAEWFRGPLRPALADVLLDERSVSRPYFRAGAVQRVFDEHMAGRDHTVRLAALLALELTVRLLVEQDGN